MQAATHQPSPPRGPQQSYPTTYTPAPGGEPFRVSFTGDGIDVSGRLTTEDRADELIRAITALKTLLNPVSGPMATEYTDDEEGRAAKARDEN